jgi:hypothetical protein
MPLERFEGIVELLVLNFKGATGLMMLAKSYQHLVYPKIAGYGRGQKIEVQGMACC